MADRQNRPRRRRRRSWLARTLIWGVVTVAVLMMAVVIATPWIVRATVPGIFARYGVEASVGGGTLNPLRREVTLEDFVLGATEAPALSFGELGIGLGLRALLDGRIRLRHLRVKNVSLNAGRLLALREALDKDSAPGGTGPSVELDEVALEDVRLVSLGERIGHEARIDRLHVQDLGALLGDGQSRVTVGGAIGGGHVDLALDVGRQDGAIRARGTFQLGEIPTPGWARLAGGEADPFLGGQVSGRGTIDAHYRVGDETLGIALDGRLAVGGLELSAAPVAARDGAATWQGRLALDWSPRLASPALRGDGALEVERVRLSGTDPATAPFRADVSELSWKGGFDWKAGFEWKGSVAAARVGVAGAPAGQSAWRIAVEDLAARLRGSGIGELEARAEDLDLARVTVTVGAGAAPVVVSAEKLAIDELRSARSGGLTLGVASTDTLTVGFAPRDGETATVRADKIEVKGLAGDFAGKLQAADVTAVSLDLAGAGQRVRVDGVALASVGFSVPAWVGAGELRVSSLRAEHGSGDIWVSDLRATKLHGAAAGPFGAQSIDVAHAFQSGSAEFTWEAATMKLRGLNGDFADAAMAATADLERLKVGIHDTAWVVAGVKATQMSLGRDGDARAGRVEVAKLERREPGAGSLTVSELGASALQLSESRGALDGLKAARLRYDTYGGDAFDLHGLEAWNVGGSPAGGLRVKRFSAARGAGHLVGGARLAAGRFEARTISVAADGEVAVETARLGSFSHAGADRESAGLEDARVTRLRWTPGGALDAHGASIGTARYGHTGDTEWELSQLTTGDLKWDGASRVEVGRAALVSAGQARGAVRDWRAHDMEAAGFRLDLPDRFAVASVAVAGVQGGSGSPGWSVRDVTLRGLGGSRDAGQTVDAIASGAVGVTDATNGAALDIDGLSVQGLHMASARELSFAKGIVTRLRLRSSEPDWPSRLTVPEARIDDGSLGVDGVVDLGRVVARAPYLIMGQSKDNAWMWPPLPGAGGGGSPDGSRGGLRVTSFATRGAARVAYIDRATEPVFHLTVDPLVIALQSLDTTLPGNVARFRALGTGPRYSELAVRGELRTAVEGFDLTLGVDVKGAYVPEVNPYVVRHEPISASAGRGDVHGDIHTRNRVLGGEVDVLLSGLELRTTLGGEIFQSIDPANFPIRTALALLKDREGNIKLKIPLRMDTSKPKYDFVDDFQKAFVETVTTTGQAAANIPGKTLDGALQLLERTISLLPGVDATRYGPVSFDPGAEALTARPLVYLDQLGRRMRRHDALVLALCGRAVATEGASAAAPPGGIDGLFAQARAGEFPTLAPGRKGLLALAEARSRRVRAYLRGEHGIPTSRLAACDPRVDDTADAKPRVDLVVKTPAKSGGFLGILP